MMILRNSESYGELQVLHVKEQEIAQAESVQNERGFE
jgi:hypothetical protein